MRHAERFLCVFGLSAGLALAGCGGDDDGMEPTGDGGGPTGDAGSMTGGGDSGMTGGDGGMTGGDEGGSAATWTQVWNVFDSRGCNTATCHGAATQAGGLDMSSKQTAYDALVGVQAGGAGSTCGDSGLALVQAGSPNQSLLQLKLEKKAGMGDTCGSGMPQTGQALTSEQISAVRSWIADGAPDN